ncbi:MAG TPA: DUF3108 domain-containing protein [Candidatus Barnesiella excrementavium]|nr:DUF3108 domain-containing protein [Candidatus Barnesiella excrementavium]
MRYPCHTFPFATLRNTILAVALLVGSLLPAATTRAQSLPGVQNERLSYDIIYQLGFLWKRAATATLQLTVRPNSYHSILTARTLPFADNIFRVRDTLVADMHRNHDLTPIYYAKLADEDHTYRKDEVHYLYNGTATTGQIRLYRPKRNVIEDYTLTEPGFVYDMLSIFYVIRSFNFRAMNMNQLYKTKIFSGKSLEYLHIEYLGQEILKQNKKEYSTFKVRLHFYNSAGKKTSDNISAWIGTDSRRIPLKVEGKLALGSMKAVYTGD